METLWANARHFKAGLADLGLNTGRSETPITPVIVGEAEKAHALSDKLRSLGIFVQSVAYPTVARDAARVRVMVSAAHSRDDLDQAIGAFCAGRRRLGPQLRGLSMGDSRPQIEPLRRGRAQEVRC